MEEVSTFGDRDHRNRADSAGRADRSALERIECDVDLRRVRDARVDTQTHALTDVEHRRLVALALADDDGAVDANGVERFSHRIDGGLVGRFFVAATHPSRARESGGFGDANEFECEVAVHAGRRALRCRGRRSRHR